MAKYSRVDGRKPWGCGSTTCIIAFLALSLIGVWMLLINSIVPENPNPSIQEVNHMKDLTKEEENDENLQEEFVKERSYKNTKSEKEMKEVSGNDGDGKRDGWESSRLDEDLNSQGEGKETVRSEEDGNEQNQTEQKFVESKPIIEEKSGEIKPEDNRVILTEDEKVDLNQDKYSEKFLTKNAENQDMNQASTEEFIFGKESETVSRDTDEQAAWLSQTVKSKNEKESQQSLLSEYEWKLCKTTAGPDYIPCLDNWQVIRKLPSTGHYEHRERHCPDEAPTCLVPMPWGYKRPIRWPESRNRIWFHNAPHTKLGEVKGHQNWVKVNGDYLTFPGGGTQFKNGALHYIDFIQKSLPRIAWGKRTRVVLDIGCGVASFGGFLFDRGVLTMSIAPKDEHEAQVQFALERGIPAILGVMGTKRLPFPGTVFDVVHCARCRVPWHIEGGKLLLELNRVLRPGGYFVWSATPVYQKLPEDVGIWKAMSRLTKSMCWDLITIKRDRVNAVAAAIYRKPTSNECYKQRTQKEPPLCKESDDLNKAWNVSLRACMHKVAVDASEQGSSWPEQWPLRLQKPPKWLNSHVGVYGKTSPGDFTAEYRHWNNVFSQSYLDGMGIDWSFVRNVMDMRAVYGGFAAALADLKVWVMNVVPIDSPNTLPIIYERGLLGIYHDWCESFNTYPRSYDLLHADRLFSRLKKRCNIMAVIAEVDRILRPEGILIIWDDMETVNLLENLAKSLKWEIRLSISKDKEGLLCLKKKFWRPTVPELIAAANVQA